MRTSFGAIAGLIAGAALASLCFLLPRQLANEPHLTPPDYLPTAVRGLLDTRMQRGTKPTPSFEPTAP